MTGGEISVLKFDESMYIRELSMIVHSPGQMDKSRLTEVDKLTVN